MRISTFFLADGIAQDSTGAFSAIRLGQSVIYAPVLPTQTKRAVYLSVSDDHDEFNDHRSVSRSIVITSPSGGEVSRVDAVYPLAPKPYLDLPGDLPMPAEFVLELHEAGRYIITATVFSEDGSQVEDSLALYVVESPPAI